jgi:diacylglycerol O-acyltransferase
MRTSPRSGPHGDGPDRLGIGDLMTLWAEQPSAAWNIAIAGLLDRDALPDSDEALREEVERRLDAVPQLRRRLLWTHVGAGRTVWIDDPHFDVADHVRIVPLQDASTT